MLVSETGLTFRNASGQSLALLTIYERTQGTLHLLDDVEAASLGEAPLQLVEGRVYEYSLVPTAEMTLRLRESPTLQPSRLSHLSGRIEPGLNTGAMSIELVSETGELVARSEVEVRTDKLDYQSEYRYMLESIAAHCCDLLLDVQAPSQVRLQPSSTESTPSLHQRMAFLTSLLSSASFHQALDYIVADPHRRMISERAESPTHRGIRQGRTFTTSLTRSAQRIAIPTTHPAHGLLQESGVTAPTLPKSVSSYRRYETTDTPENRFVLFALQEFRQTLADVLEILQPRADVESIRLRRELSAHVSDLDRRLSTPLFRSIGRAALLPLGSPVLQRRIGYREVLSSWLQFNLSAQLTWTGGNDVYSAGKKNVAVLYEYWCYFLLLEVISQIVTFEQPPSMDLIEASQSGLHFRLRAGRSLDMVGTHVVDGSRWHVRFSYNRTFSGVVPSSEGSYPRAGSWTRAMRPDYTISIWPDGRSENVAEIEDCIVHLHFDAKYRVDTYLGLFGTSDDFGVDDDDALKATSRAKRSDLLKMHAYRDAIRRSAGAYVLYPGPDNGDTGWIEYHEILPGLGAFAARPGHEARTEMVLGSFLSDVLKHITQQ